MMNFKGRWKVYCIKGLLMRAYFFVVVALLTSKKDDRWHMCVDRRAISQIIVKYRFLIPRFDDIRDIMVDLGICTKII